MIEQYRTSIKDFSIASAHFGLAKALRGTGKFDEARVQDRIVLQLLSKEVGEEVLQTPYSPDGVGFSIAGVYQSLAGLEGDAGDREAETSVWQSVVDLLQKNLEPEVPVYWGIIGQAFYRIDRVEDSRAALEKTIGLLEEKTPTIKRGPRWWYLTMALAKLGEKQMAREYLNALVDELGDNPSEPMRRLRRAAEIVVKSSCGETLDVE